VTGLAVRSPGPVAIGFVALALAGCGGAFPMPSADDFETWSRTPLAPDPGMAKVALEEVHGACRGNLDAAVPLQILIQDRRTASTAGFLLMAPSHFGSCLISAGGAGGGSSTDVMPTLNGVITVDEQGSGESNGNHTDTLGGLVAPNVASVKVGRRDGIEIIASVANGYWLTWWPGGEPAVMVTAIDADGVILATLNRQGDSWVDRGVTP
jgi:hypothetical protein